MICTLSTTLHRSTQKHLRWHSITKILRNGPRAHFPFSYPESKIRRIHSRKSHSGPNHAFMYKGETSSSRQSTHAKLPKKKTPKASNDSNISFKTFDASYVLTNKSGKVVAKYVGASTRGQRLVFGYLKFLCLMSKDPKPFGYLKSRTKLVL
jgi:hypothetical protein